MNRENLIYLFNGVLLSCLNVYIAYHMHMTHQWTSFSSFRCVPHKQLFSRLIARRLLGLIFSWVKNKVGDKLSAKWFRTRMMLGIPMRRIPAVKSTCRGHPSSAWGGERELQHDLLGSGQRVTGTEQRRDARNARLPAASMQRDDATRKAGRPWRNANARINTN